MRKGKFNCIVDAAHGSSAKGAASTRLVDIYNVSNVSSCNYPNAGHTALREGKKFVSKALPTSAALNMFGKATPKLWIGPGSGFFKEQFFKELAETGYPSAADVNIHERATIVTDRHVAMEAPGGLQSTEYISSTMSGSGAAFAEKAMRRPEVLLARDSMQTLSPVAFMHAVRAEMDSGATFMHEVSQGWALSVNHGSHYPQCTFRDCTAQQAYADFSITPKYIGDVYLNVRSYPIRVGNNYRDGEQVGYSGDFYPDQTETTWEKIAADAGFPADETAKLAERERTTVTKKIRRVATQSWSMLKDSAESVGATKLILNFPQYIDWGAYKKRGGTEALLMLPNKVREYIDKMEDVTNLRVVMVGTSAEHDDYIFLD